MALVEVYVSDGRQPVTAAGTRVQLVYVSSPAKKVIVQAEASITGIIVVGGPTVVAANATRRGQALYARETATLEISDLNTVYLDGTVSGEGATFVYMM